MTPAGRRRAARSPLDRETAYASARSLQIGDGVAVIAVTSVAANLSTIIAGLAVFGDRLGNNAFVVGVRAGDAVGRDGTGQVSRG